MNRRDSLNALRRRRVMLAIGAGSALACARVAAQPRTSPRRVAMLMPSSPAFSKPQLDAFIARLAQPGHVEGQNILIEKRWASGTTEKRPALARELLALNPEVVSSVPVSTSTTGTQLGFQVAAMVASGRRLARKAADQSHLLSQLERSLRVRLGAHVRTDHFGDCRRLAGALEPAGGGELFLEVGIKTDGERHRWVPIGNTGRLQGGVANFKPLESGACSWALRMTGLPEATRRRGIQ